MWKSFMVWAQDCFLPFHLCRGLFPVPFFQSQCFFTWTDPKRVCCPSPNVVKLLHHWGKRREWSSHGFMLYLHRYCFPFQSLYHLRKLALLHIHPPALFVIIWLGLGRKVCNLLPTLLRVPFQEVLYFHASSHSDVSNSSNILSWPHFLPCYLPTPSKPIFMSCLLGGTYFFLDFRLLVYPASLVLWEVYKKLWFYRLFNVFPYCEGGNSIISSFLHPKQKQECKWIFGTVLILLTWIYVSLFEG